MQRTLIFHSPRVKITGQVIWKPGCVALATRLKNSKRVSCFEPIDVNEVRRRVGVRGNYHKTIPVEGKTLPARKQTLKGLGVAESSERDGVHLEKRERAIRLDAPSNGRADTHIYIYMCMRDFRGTCRVFVGRRIIRGVINRRFVTVLTWRALHRGPPDSLIC